MAKRDPIKTARNKMITQMTLDFRAILPKVLAETGIASETSLNAISAARLPSILTFTTNLFSRPMLTPRFT